AHPQGHELLRRGRQGRLLDRPAGRHEVPEGLGGGRVGEVVQSRVHRVLPRVRRWLQPLGRDSPASCDMTRTALRAPQRLALERGGDVTGRGGDVTGAGCCLVPGSAGESSPPPPFKEPMMNLALWIVAGLMATVCLIGSAKMFVPKERLAAAGGAATRWVEDFSPGALKAIGAVEFLAAAGLVLPAVLGIAPV